MKKLVITVICITMTLGLAATAMAQFPSGAQGDQYVVLNAALDAAAADAGISPETFISIYDTAAAGGDLSGFSASQLAAACQVLSALAPYQSLLVDYNTVFNALGCSTRLAALTTTTTRGALPTTGIALAILVGSSVVGLGAASRLVKRNRA